MNPSFRPTRLLCVLLCLLAVFASAQVPLIRIMPMGDSITDGTSFNPGNGGYRLTLYNLLTSAGYNVDYIGSLTINSQNLVEKEHEGHSGWRIDQLDSNVAGWFSSLADPDVILLHIGTNDFGQSLNTTTAINRLDALITKMAALRPYAHIIVTNLMERGEPYNTTIQAQFNPYVQGVVDAQAAQGRRVTFLDMRSAVPLSDMPDSLHPGPAGYDKMANAWLPAIQSVITPFGDDAPPAISRARGQGDGTHVQVTFSKPISDASADPANFSISGGLTVSAAQLDASKRIITLTTSAQSLSTTYTVTVNNVQDLIVLPHTIAANSTATFTSPIPRGYATKVPESNNYTLVYAVDLPTTADFKVGAVPYTLDNHLAVGPFDRVAYYLELQAAGGDLQYAWVSMDAFTNNSSLIGVPTLASGAQFQQSVTGMTVISNVAGVATGTGLTGNLEFWPSNYQQANFANVPGASGSTYDFGDQATAGNYGSMQIHNTGAAQTVLAFNNWGGNATPGNVDLGIGNDPGAPGNGGGLDWTFSHNGANYTVKSLQVLVRTSNDVTPPTLVSAKASYGLTQVTVTFSEPINPGTVSALNFSLNGGVNVLGAVLALNQRDVILTTTTQPTGTPLTLTVSGVRDSSASANLIAPGSTIAVGAPALPPEIVANVGAAANGSQLVYSLDVPAVGNLNAANQYKVDDHLTGGPFTRVAYYFELQTAAGQTQYVWASMDAFTGGRGKIGVPLTSTGAIFQQNVTNLDVISNVSGVTNGTGLTGGNIEFWPTSYTAANGANVPNALAAKYDTGDTRTAGTYGSMQIHNHDANQVLMAINHFGGDGVALEVGIGNNPATGTNDNPDYTFSNNAGTYLKRTLHVLVLPGVTTAPAIVANAPEAANYQLVYSQNIPNTGNFTSGTGFAAYTVDNRADINGFTRVAYYMELQGSNPASTRYVWVSMDAFTNNVGRIGIPNLASGAVFQQNVANMNVFCNVAGVANGTGITTGNIEFWPTNYDGVNAANVPGASATNFDFGDRATAGNYGSMQVHNYGSAPGFPAHTIFGLNHWGAAGGTGLLCVGIGNSTLAANSSDWTFADNSGGTTVDIKKVLQVYVLPGNGDFAGPTIASIRGSSALNRLVVTFNETLADTAANPANFSIPGLTVTGATLLASQKEVALTTSAQTGGTVYTVNVSGVRDRSPAGNLVAGGTSGTFTAYTVPAVLAGIPDAASYQLIYRLAIPTVKPQWNLNTIPYLVDESKYGDKGFDRVAYCLELDSNWVYASFDAFTTTLTKIGVPNTAATTTAFQQNVAHMNVASNVASIVQGTNIATGNIEFWGGNYTQANQLNVPNASPTTYDWGDTMTAGGHGSMQVHNYGAVTGTGTGQTLFGYDDWGNNAPSTGNSDLGIGTQPTGNPDWTSSGTAGNYTVKNLYVLAHLTGLPSGTAPTLLSNPVARSVSAGGSANFAVMATGASTYQWRRNGTPIPGATNSWLALTGATPAVAGSYDVVVSGSGGAPTTSLAATLTYVNTAPTVGNFSLTTKRNTATSITRAALRTKAADVDGDTLVVSAVSAASVQGGTVVLGASDVTYTPPVGYLGADSFTFTISDGAGGTVNGTVNISVTSLTPVAAGQVAYGFRGDGKFDVVFAGTPGQPYQLQRATDLTVANPWSTILTLSAGDDGLLPLVDPAPPAGHAYYRIQVVP